MNNGGSKRRTKRDASASPGARSAGKRNRAQRMSPAARRRQLLRCAVNIFALKGIGEARHTDLAAAAGVAVPTAFHYFPTREDLTRAVLEEVHRFLMEDIVKPHYDERCSAPEAVERILLEFHDAIDSHPEYVRVWLEWSVAVRAGLWEAYLVFYGRANEAIRAILARGKSAGTVKRDIDLDDAARVIVGLAHMIVQMKYAGSSRDAIVRTIHSLVDGYLVRR